MPHVLAASLSLDREPRRHRQPGIGHLGQARTLAAEIILHLAVAIGFAAAERVNVLGCGFLAFLDVSFGESRCRHENNSFALNFSVVQRFQRCVQT